MPNFLTDGANLLTDANNSYLLDGDGSPIAAVVSSAGVLVEIAGPSVRVSSIVGYAELSNQIARVSGAGAYVEVSWNEYLPLTGANKRSNKDMKKGGKQ